jgi:hypothetical protein
MVRDRRHECKLFRRDAGAGWIRTERAPGKRVGMAAVERTNGNGDGAC